MHPDGREHPARPDGRSGDSGRVLAWAPGLEGAGLIEPDVGDAGFADPSETDVPAGREHTPDPFDDLDLVITPVSVTPPRTWRRAAWFAVGASCVVLTVLVFAAARLAGPESPFDRLDAFPGLPTGGLLTAQPPEPPVPTRTADTTTAEEQSQTVLGAPTSAGITRAGGQPGQVDVNQPGGPGPGQPSRTTGPTPTSRNSFENPTTSPTVSLLPTTGSPPVTAESMISATRRFYNALPKDLDTAWSMVGPRVKVQGFENFRRQWSNATEVTLQQVLVNANDSSVLATVHITGTDGGQYVQHFRLVFRQGNMLTIEEIQPTDGDGGNKPVR